MWHGLLEVLLCHALGGRELLPVGLALDVVLVHGARAVDDDLEGADPVLLGLRGRGGWRVEGHRRRRRRGCGCSVGGGVGSAILELGGPQDVVDAAYGRHA